ncbi:MAG: hypothetical protein A2Z04_04625 [Chloroflexi bacterium RBG_16_57_9]|nr:MAG: hypothetical protein A2Z04_04625 [Chloroflexi bacterium RBG_16_57_9]
MPKADVDKTASEVLPYAVGKAIADEPLSATILSPSTLFYYKTARSRPVLENALKVAEELPADHALRTMLDTDAFLDTVESVESISNDGQFDEVYNLTLCDIHSYWANQLLVANCGCFECIVMVIPEANGVMVVSREDTSMTPSGMTFSTLAGICGGGIQTPGVMGIGKYYLTSKKFLAADGGFMRVVWMSRNLKESMSDELHEAAAHAGDPDLIEKIADERIATTVDDLLAWLEDKNHPAMIMPPLF